jgi:phosphoribosylformylglycinamidine cyclo-ligase
VSKSPRESSLYAKVGASSSKAGIEGALERSESSALFCDLNPDVCGDPNYLSILHADGAGTKSIIAYLAFRETGDIKYFRSLAQDSLVMNIDDLACVNAFENLMLSNTIGRNRRLIPDEAVGEIVKGYQQCVETLRQQGVEIAMSGGETADLGDLVRTLVVDSSLFARVKKSKVLNFQSCKAGDLIIGFSSTGQAVGETAPNSGVASNGVSLLRHALIGKNYLEKYPEIFDSIKAEAHHYAGFANLLEKRPELPQANLLEAMLSPTRSYAPLLKKILELFFEAVHGAVHCTGGGQTKICKFAPGLAFVKDNLFPCPPLFELVKQRLGVPWSEMYAVFNMGHRMEIIVDPAIAADVIALAEDLGIAARPVGQVIKAPSALAKLVIKSPHGEFVY